MFLLVFVSLFFLFSACRKKVYFWKLFCFFFSSFYFGDIHDSINISLWLFDLLFFLRNSRICKCFYQQCCELNLLLLSMAIGWILESVVYDRISTVVVNYWFPFPIFFLKICENWTAFVHFSTASPFFLKAVDELAQTYFAVITVTVIY